MISFAHIVAPILSKKINSVDLVALNVNFSS